MQFPRMAALGSIMLLAACSTKAETAGTDSILRDIRPSPGFDTTGADCAGRLYRDTAHTVSGTSECKNGAGVFFSGHSDTALAADLSCDYALFYDNGGKGTGRIACTDGSTGDFSFIESDSTHGLATVRMKDGREIKLTYTQGVQSAP